MPLIYASDWKMHELGLYGDTPSCNCSACVKLRELKMATTDGWCDPRRQYLEGNDAEFIKRVPDGILRWPYDHIGYWTVPYAGG